MTTTNKHEADYKIVLKALQGCYISGECYAALERMKIALSAPAPVAAPSEEAA